MSKPSDDLPRDVLRWLNFAQGQVVQAGHSIKVGNPEVAKTMLQCAIDALNRVRDQL